MEAYEIRMKVEFSQLKGRIMLLEDFIESDSFSNVDVSERKLMRDQLSAMKAYSECLFARCIRHNIKIDNRRY